MDRTARGEPERGLAHRVVGIVWAKFGWNFEIEISHVQFQCSLLHLTAECLFSFPQLLKNSLMRCEIGRNIQICGEMPSQDAAAAARPTLLPRSFIMRMSLPSQFSRSLLGGGLLHSDYAI